MNFALAPTAAIIIFAVARWSSPISRLLASRAFVELGEASYSIYLIHFVVFMGIVRTNLALLSAPAPNLMIEIARFSAILAAIFAVSMISYAVIEVPARRWLRGLWSQSATGSRRRPLYAVAAAPAILAVIVAIVGPIFLPARQTSSDTPNVTLPYKSEPDTVR
jgi:peptidoglycan/LPS O-acetylase OafA/YrhL